LSAGAAYKALTIVKLKQLQIPLPDLETQRQIVAQIEKEQALVNANKQLIEIFEQKIKDRIAKVWGVEKTEEATLSRAAEPATEYLKN
jgi:type I restriction enzyme M protein